MVKPSGFLGFVFDKLKTEVYNRVALLGFFRRDHLNPERSV
jgi:hypothetical protein